MINAVFAADPNGGMGVRGSLPWPHNSEDLANFKKLTDDQVVVMGSKTWNDPKMPKPLKGRTVYVASRNPVWYASRIDGSIIVKVAGIHRRHDEQDVFVIGGPNLIIECEPLYTYIYITHFRNEYKVDTSIDLDMFLQNWVPVSANVSHDFQSTTIKYKRKD